MVRAVIFDVDGTLVDSVDLHAQSWQDAFSDFGYAVDFTAIRQQIGKGGDQLMPVFLSQAEIDKDGKGLEQHRAAILKTRYLGKVSAFPEVRALFERIRADHTKIALASSAKQDELATYKEITGVADLLETETSSDDADKSKPHPDIFQAAMQRLGDIPAAEILVVGDTPYDAQAAASAGLKTIGVLCGGFSQESLQKAGCIAIYRDPADLLANYEQSPLAS